MYKVILHFLILMGLLNIPCQLSSQSKNNDFWSFSELKDNRSTDNRMLKKMPTSYQMSILDMDAWAEHLRRVPKKKDIASDDNGFVVDIPTPTGGFQSFYLVENSIIAPEVAHLYTVKTYQGVSKDASRTPIRCSLSETGFSIFVYDNKQPYIIEPFEKGNHTEHIIYYKNELEFNGVKCGHVGNHERKREGNSSGSSMRAPVTNLRTFRLAVAVSGEYSQQFGGSPYSTTNVLNSIATGINMIIPIFERDIAVTFSLVSNGNLAFPDPATDPYNPFGNQNTLLAVNNTVITNELGSGGFDIGHLFVWADTGGLAGAEVCIDSGKAEGFSGNDGSVTTLFIDYGAHEIGHQFGANHNFVSQECGTSESGFRFEPGEGSSIMAYADVCGAPASYQSFADPYFHSKSIESMLMDIENWSTCHTNSGTGNSAEPISDAKADITIPMETPFVLVGSASDGNDASGQLTYVWEQIDGTGSAVNGPPNCNSGVHPLFRYRPPESDAFRVFPELSEVLAGNNNGVDWEKLPCTNRSINFNLIVRDNNSNWGRIGNDQMVVTVANTGPFEVTAPNGGENWTNPTNTVSWSENGTSVHCPNVDILLSIDDGNSYTVLASNVTNDGSHDISVAMTSTTDARILVQCSTGGNFRSASTFFDVSNAKFSISVPLPVDLISFEATPVKNEKVKLNWVTASEENSSHFEVERSPDGENFAKIGIVNSAGNTINIQNYELLDERPFVGSNYYRLRQVDVDGSFSYSETKLVSILPTGQKITVYPNPAKNVIFIDGFETTGQLVIYDELGKVVKELNTIESEIDIRSIPSGVYYFNFLSTQYNETKKMIIYR